MFFSFYPLSLSLKLSEPGICRRNKESRGIENRGKIYFPWEKIDKHTFFYEKKMMDL